LLLFIIIKRREGRGEDPWTLRGGKRKEGGKGKGNGREEGREGEESFSPKQKFTTTPLCGPVPFAVTGFVQSY